MFKHYLADKSGQDVAINQDVGEDRGLIVATRPHKTFENTPKFFYSTSQGIDMNVNPGALGTPDKVHDGIDSALWTAADEVGGTGTTFNSSDQDHTTGGGNSIKVERSPVGDIFKLTKASDLNCSSYASLSMWIYVDSDWAAGDNIRIYGWDTGTGLQVGNSVGLQDYFTYGVFGSWQKLIIPLTDFGALSAYTTLDELRVEVVAKNARPPIWYVDDIQFEQTGSPVEYTISPNKSTWLHVCKLVMSMADAHTGFQTVSGATQNATLPGLPYDGFLSLGALRVGMTYKRVIGGVTSTVPNSKGLLDILQLPGTRVSGFGGDGVNAWMTVTTEFVEPVILKAENSDQISFAINDDMSDLSRFRIVAGCKTEQR